MKALKPLRLRIRLTSEHGIVMGPGRADLLDFIAQTGSIAASARAMKMSYRRAWTLVEDLNSTFTAPLVETSKGGAERGGARLTELGTSLLTSYRAMEAFMQDASKEQRAYFESALATAVKP